MRASSRPRLVPIIVAVGLAVAACGADDDDADSATADTSVVDQSTVAPGTSDGAGAEGCVDDFDEEQDYFPTKAEVVESELWTVEYEGHYKVVRVGVETPTGGGDARSDVYVLVQCGTPAPPLEDDLAGATVVEIPVSTVVPTYYEDVTALHELGRSEQIAAIPDAAFLDDVDKQLPTVVVDAVAAGDVDNFGDTVSAEFFVALDPDVVFAYSVYGYDDHDTLSTAGVPVVGVLNAAEPTPLGDAEWIKFLGLFFNDEAGAARVFDEVASNYRALVDTAATATEEPGVVFMSPYSAEYIEAHQNSWGARLIEDAGGANLLAAGGPTSPQAVSVEAAIEAAAVAEVWLTEFSAFDLAETATEIEGMPFATFPAVADGQVWNIGLTDPARDLYYGVWSTRPDLLLADLISLLHPELLPDHDLSVLEAPITGL